MEKADRWGEVGTYFVSDFLSHLFPLLLHLAVLLLASLLGFADRLLALALGLLFLLFVILVVASITSNSACKL